MISTSPTLSVRLFSFRSLRHLRPSLTFESAKIDGNCDYRCYDRLLHQPSVQHYGAKPQPSPEGAEHDGLHRASDFLPDEHHIRLCANSRTSYQSDNGSRTSSLTVKANYFRTPLSSRTASRPQGCQETSIYYRFTTHLCPPSSHLGRSTTLHLKFGTVFGTTFTTEANHLKCETLMN